MRDTYGPAFPSKRVSHWQAKPGPTINSPSTAAEAVYEYHGGMSLRDYFAGQALPAVIRQCFKDINFNGWDGTPEEYFAHKSYALADAMLKERDK